MGSPIVADVDISGGRRLRARRWEGQGRPLVVLLAPVGFGPIRLADVFALPGVNGVAAAALPRVLASPLLITAAYSTMVSRRRLPTRELVDRLRAGAARSGPGARAAVLAIAA